MLLTDNDRNALEACRERRHECRRIFALLDNFVEEGVQQGPIHAKKPMVEKSRFPALVRASAVRFIMLYMHRRSKCSKRPAAAAERCLRPECSRRRADASPVDSEAFITASSGRRSRTRLSLGWLHYAKFLALRWETEAAQAAVQRGLELVPGDANS